METIDLPWLKSDATVGDAVDKLIELNRFGDVAAVVTKHGDTPMIIDAAEIIAVARHHPGQKLVDVEPVSETMSIEFEVLPAPADAVLALDSEDAQYGVLRETGPVARVVTRHVHLGRQFRIHVSICRCTGKRRHIWDPSDLRKPGTCNICHAPVVCS